MNTLLIVLFVFVFLIFCTSVYLLRNPELFEKEAVIADASHREIPFVFSDLCNESFDVSVHREICLKWPDFRVMLQKVNLQDALLYHWTGLHKSDANILFVVDEKQGLESLMNGLTQWNDNHQVPCCDLWFVLPLNSTLHQSVSSAVSYMETKQAKPQLIVRRGLGVKPDQEGKNRGYAGMYDKPFYRIAVKGDNEEYDFMSSLDETKLFEAEVPDAFEEAYACMKDQLPDDIRKAYQKKWLHEDKFISAMIQYDPDLKWMFYPHIRKNEDEIILSAVNRSRLITAYDTLCKYAKKQNVTLEKLAFYPGQKVNGNAHFETIRQAYQSACGCNVTISIPYECRVEEVIYTDVPVVTVSGMFLMQKVNLTMENRFYEAILSKLNISAK